MSIDGRTRRLFLALGTILGTALAVVPAPLAAATLGDQIDLGRGKEGEFCEAQRIGRDAVATGLFDVGYNVRCRGWTDTLWIGRVYSLSTPATIKGFATATETRLSCAAPGTVSVPGVGTVMARRCRDRASGRNAVAMSVVRGGVLQAAIGLEPFAGNLASGLRTITSGSDAKAVEIDLSGLAPPPPLSEAAAGVGKDGDVAESRQDVRTYSARGQFGDARELANTYLSKLPPDASIADKIDLRLEAALSESNLAYSEAAAALLADAARLLDGPNAPFGTEGDLLRVKLQIYSANNALNRRDNAGALALADAALQPRASVAGEIANPLQDALTLRRINASGKTGASGAIGLADSGASSEAQLRALAEFVRGNALAGLGRAAESENALVSAQKVLTDVGLTDIESVKLSWLVSSIAAQRARLADERGDGITALTSFNQAVAALERTSLYRDSPLLAQRRIDKANFLRRQNRAAEAKAEFAAALQTLEAVGPSATSGISGLDGYFELLAAENAAGGDNAKAAAGAFFRTSQFINPPALTAQIAAMKKIYESGDAAGAARARALEDLGRERRALATRISGLPSGADADRATLQAQLTEIERRSAEVTAELAGDQQYLRANDSAVELAEIQAALAPREALLKIVWLPRRSYAIVATRETAVVYPLGKTSAEIVDAVARVRRSIDGRRSAAGVRLVDFDVDNARLLDAALLGPVQPVLADVDALVVDAAGPFNQLPLGILITDDDSISRFNITAKVNALDYTGIKFLAGAVDLSTTVSPRAFLVARQQAPSREPRPYLGFGDPSPMSELTLAGLGKRGAYARCTPAELARIKGAFENLGRISPAELQAGVQAFGNGSELVVEDTFTDSSIDTQNAEAKPPYGQFQVVHFATHGLKENELGCDSPPALLTSTAVEAASDGLLSFEEIAALKLDANLVILSACNTAAETSEKRARELGFRVGEAGAGATLNGLVRAFFSANTRAVLTTHWAIPNNVRTRGGVELAPSTLLMQALFNAATTKTIAGSVRAAQTSLRSNADLSHPYYWGAFTVVGDGSKAMITQATGAIADARP